MIVIPIVAGIVTSILFLRRTIGRVSVRRVLTQDSNRNRAAWKLLVTAIGRPIEGCTVRYGGEILCWEGTGEKEIDIGAGGAGQVAIPPEDSEPDEKIIVKSGSFTIYRSSLRNTAELRVSC